MTGRVWAPTRPTVDPDRVVLALLEAGDDPEKDLGAALLAVHRAGAAACQVVAAAPVPDEVALIRTLAECRGRVAPAVAESVSKSVDDPQYAHLLTRDVFDDAEQAALSLFRACVAKGVSPPLACQRVGHVFGVPREHLGRYLALATNPVSNAVALVDAADRALLAHVAKVARSETEDTKVTISKAPAKEEWRPPATLAGDGDAGRKPPPRGLTGSERQDFNRKHPRNEDGEFTEVARQPESRMDAVRRLLGMGPSAPRVAESPAVPPERAERAQRTERAERAQRTERVTRPTRSRATPARKPATRKPVKLAPKLPAPRPKIQAMAAETKPRRLKPEDRPEAVLDVLATVKDPSEGTYHELSDVELSISLPVAKGQFFREQMIGRGVRGDPFIFRMGQLVGYGGEMELDGGPEALHLREIAAQTQWDDLDDQNEPVIHRIPPSELFNKDEDDIVKEVTRRLSTEVVQTDQGTQYHFDEAKHDLIKVYQDTKSEDLLLVEYQPATPGGTAVPVMVDEFYIDGELGSVAIGRIEGGKQHPEFRLDPNQAYQLVSEVPTAYYDTDSHTVVNRWKLRPIDEDDVARIASTHRMRFGKAAREEFRPRVVNPAFEATVRRDEEGRFAEEDESVQRAERTQRAERAERAERVTRTVRATPVRTAGLRARTPAARQMAQLQPRTAMARGLTAHLAERRPGARELPELHDDRRYHVLSGEEMERIQHRAQVSADKQAFLLTSRAQEALYSTDVYLGDKAAVTLRDNVATMVAQREGNARSRPLFRLPNRTEDDMYALGQRINQEFDKRPELAEVYIEEVGHGMVQVWGNHYAVARQHLIEIEDGTNFDTLEIELVYLGEAKSKDMLLRGRDSWPLLTMNEDEALIQKPFNAPLARYVLRNATVDRWRAGPAEPDLPQPGG